MFIYFLMVAYVFIIGVFGKYRVTSGSVVSKHNNNTSLLYALLIFALPVFYIGLRTYVADTSAYIDSFNRLNADFSALTGGVFDSRGYGWVFLEIFFKKFISTDVYIFLMAVAIFQAGALAKFYYKYSTDYPFSILLFFLSASFTNMMNGMRQFLAICLILFFADWIFKKKYIGFLIVVFFALTIHIAAILWFAAIFLIQGKPANIRMIIASFLVLLSVAFVDQFTNVLSDSISETTYVGYTNQFNEDDGANIAHTLIAVVPLVIAFIGRNRIKENDDRVTYVLINIAILGAMTSLLSNFTSGILIGRLTTDFTIFNYALLPRLFVQVFDEKNERTLRLLCILGYLAYFIYYIFYMNFDYNSVPLGIN